MIKKLLLSFIGIVSACGFAYAQPGFTCAEAIVISSLPYSTSDNTGNYGNTTNTMQAQNCQSASDNYMNGNDVFYSYTATNTGIIKVTLTPGAGEDKSGIFVYDGCANVGISCVDAQADFGSAPRIIPTLAVTAGHTYIFAISKNGFFPPTFSYSLNIQDLNCLFPTNLAVNNVGQTSADLSWSNPGGADNFEIVVQPSGIGMPTGSGVPINSSSYTATGLDSDTFHEYWVRADCGDGTFSIWQGPKSFKTNIANSLCVIDQQCNYIFHTVDAFGDSWNGNTMTVSQNGNIVGVLQLYGYNEMQPVPLCAGEPFELFWNAGGNFPSEVIISIINPFGQTIYHKPYAVGSQNSLLFHGVTNCNAPICPAPSNVRFTDLSAGSLTVTWTELGTATLWEVLVLPTGSPAPTASDLGIETSTNPLTIAGLIDGGEYDVYVRAICADDFKSDWTLPVTAIATCPPAVTLHEFGGDSINGVSWWAELASQWEVIMQPSGLPAPDASASGIIVNSPQYTIDSSLEGTFDIYVRAICSTSESIWSTPYTIGITCAQVSNVTVTGNVLSWTSNASASQWEVRVYEGNASYPYNDNFDSYLTSDNPFVIPNIVVGEDYSIYVRSICATDDSSIWSTQRLFVYSGPLAVDEIHSDNFVIYPNPAKEFVMVSLTPAGNLDHVILYDMVGKIVNKTAGLSGTEATIDLSRLSKGIYFIEVVTEKQTKVIKKLIIQ